MSLWTLLGMAVFGTFNSLIICMAIEQIGGGGTNGPFIFWPLSFLIYKHGVFYDLY